MTTLIDEPTADEAARRLPGLGLDSYRPFVLVLLEPGSPLQTARWDGRSLIRRENADSELPLVSSGVVPDAANHNRAEDLAARILDGAGWARRRPARRLSQRATSGAPALCPSACIATDAATRSTCRVTVTAERIQLVHTPGLPCATEPLAPVAVARRPAVAS